MNVVLVMFRENGERRSFSLTRDVTVVGRREDADFRIPLSDVSRKHCRLIKDGAQLIVEDLGSANGTFHNGQRVSGEVDVGPGDTLQFGPVQFVVQIDGVPSEEELLGVGSGSSEATHVSPTAPPPLPPSLGAGDPDVIEDASELEEVEPDQIFEEISADSIAEDDVIIDMDLSEPEKSEKR